MKWIKKWYYLILLVSTGAVYLVCMNRWQVHANASGDALGGSGTQSPGYENTGDGGNGGPSVSGGDGGWNGPPVSGGDGGWNGPPVSGGDSGWTPGADDDGWTPGMGDDGWTPGADDDGWDPGDDGWTPGADDGGWDPEDGAGDSGQPDDEGTNGQIPYMTVEDDYFADAVFIGDSRTVGLGEYGGLEDITTFYASTGLSVHKLFTANIVPVSGQKKKITVEEALQQTTFSKIYLMLGINEMGTGTVDTFMEKYQEVVARLRELQPDAIIYLQGIMKVTTKRSEQGDYITNEGIEERNVRISQLADNEKIFYLDVNPLICDEMGGMEASYTHDGVHLKAKYIEIWKQFLKEHAVPRD